VSERVLRDQGPTVHGVFFEQPKAAPKNEASECSAEAGPRPAICFPLSEVPVERVHAMIRFAA
jgi:hypothetical protein